MAHRSDTLIRLHRGPVKDKRSRKNLFLWESGKSHILSLSALYRSIVHFSLSTVFPSFFYVGLAPSHFFLLCTFFVLLFLCLPIYAWKTVRRKRRRDRRRRRTEEEERQKKTKEKKEEEGQGEESYRSRYRSELVDSWSKDRSIKRISSQLEDGIEWDRSEIHLNSVYTISVVCNSAVNTSILLLVSLYYCCHYSSINHYAATLYRRSALHLISCVFKYTSRKN